MSRGIYDKVNKVLIPTAGLEDASVPTFTLAEWEAMTDAQKAEYDGRLFVISDDFNGMTVDDELSDTSVHPVQNKVITEEIQDLQDNDDAMLNVLGAKNLLPNEATSQVINGVTFTVNADGSVIIDGTATALIQLNLTTKNLGLKTNKQYILSGVGPSAGGNLYIQILWPSGTVTFATHEETVFTPQAASNNEIQIVVGEGVSLSNYVMKPMIRPASIQDDTYVPYAKTNRELTEALIVEKQEITVSGLGFDGTKKETQLTLPTVRSGYTAYMINALPNTSDTAHYISAYTNPNTQGKFYITHNLVSTVLSVTASILWVKTN